MLASSQNSYSLRHGFQPLTTVMAWFAGWYRYNAVDAGVNRRTHAPLPGHRQRTSSRASRARCRRQQRRYCALAPIRAAAKRTFLLTGLFSTSGASSAPGLVPVWAISRLPQAPAIFRHFVGRFSGPCSATPAARVFNMRLMRIWRDPHRVALPLSGQTLHSEQVRALSKAKRRRGGPVKAHRPNCAISGESSWPIGVADRDRYTNGTVRRRCATESTVRSSCIPSAG